MLCGMWDLLRSGIKPCLCITMSPALTDGFFTTEPSGKPSINCFKPLFPQLSSFNYILTYYVNYLTNMAQMSLIKHESGSVSPISIFIVFPVHSQLTDSLVCGEKKKKSVAILRSLLCVEFQAEKCVAAGLVGQGRGLSDGRGGRGQREESPGGLSFTPLPPHPAGCLGTYTPGKASCPSHLFPR